jgi:hypothetical protein
MGRRDVAVILEWRQKKLSHIFEQLQIDFEAPDERRRVDDPDEVRQILLELVRALRQQGLVLVPE